jgi:hypothetical protein
LGSCFSCRGLAATDGGTSNFARAGDVDLDIAS